MKQRNDNEIMRVVDQDQIENILEHVKQHLTKAVGITVMTGPPSAFLVHRDELISQIRARLDVIEEAE